jgi:hypothetical protein
MAAWDICGDQLGLLETESISEEARGGRGRHSQFSGERAKTDRIPKRPKGQLQVQRPGGTATVQHQ